MPQMLPMTMAGAASEGASVAASVFLGGTKRLSQCQKQEDKMLPYPVPGSMGTWNSRPIQA